MRKTLTDEDLEVLLNTSRNMVDEACKMWKIGMKVLPINSEIYRSLCAVGKKAYAAHWKLVNEAEERRWPESKIASMRVTYSCGFNYGEKQQ